MNSLLPIVLVSTCLAGVLAAVLACIPGLHIYNVLGLLFIIHFRTMGTIPIPPEIIATIVVAMISAYAVANTIPAILLAAPDESALHTVLPGQKMLLDGKGREAVILTACGSLAALCMILFSLPLLPMILPVLHDVTRPHTHWILWSVILFMLMSEWPKPIPPGRPIWQRLLLANKASAIGLLVFLLSGLLGFVLFFRSPLPYANAFQNLMPAFVGLFTLPWLMYNILSGIKPPPQQPITASGSRCETRSLRHGSLAGILGGAFAAFFPVITGGIGGMLAGHATALRSSQAFLVSQGASKTIYYSGGLLLFFIPGLHLTRGGGGSMLRAIVPPGSPYLYWMTGAATLIGGSIALLMLPGLTTVALQLAQTAGYRRLSFLAAIVMIALIAFFSGWAGLAVATIATAIGLLPLFHGTRRMNGLGVILLPMACSISGIAPAITRLLRL